MTPAVGDEASTSASLPPAAGQELPIEGKTVKALTLLSLKRTFELFAGNYGQKVAADEASQRAKIACKIRDEYLAVRDFKLPERPAAPGASKGSSAEAAANGTAMAKAGGGAEAVLAAGGAKSTTAKLIETMPKPADQAARAAAAAAGALVLHQGARAVVPTAAGGHKEYVPSAQLARRLPSKWPRPAWHAPWKMYRVVAGHLGPVRSLAVDAGNEWVVTGSADRTIKIWDLATGQLRLTLTGHIEQVTGLAVSDRHPYMFSCGLDKMVKCWDLEYNKVIRHYHGHLSGVYSLALHPTLDVLMTGGRDSVCRVWDMRTKMQVHCLTGHDDTVCSILSQSTDPQVITGAHDKTIRLWDIRRPSTMATLTYHKKSVRALAMHPTEYAFAGGSADNIKKYRLPPGEFLHNMLQNQKAIISCMAVNEDGVLVSGADNGSLWFWDWTSGNNFQAAQSVLQPGSLESEANICACAFDATGTRLLTAEGDKTIKFWRQDEAATPESHPVNFRPPRDMRRF
ncbi:hypothetical protein WJX81_000394 [Elliptochloris bilobata]|uniref:Pleiotropic regulator 1 n=1 Tax=Elliptochloris bilobata TaxID=381761 RepID=A0AAW1SCT7_9CHLO